MNDTLELTNEEVLKLYQGHVVPVETEAGHRLDVVPSGAHPIQFTLQRENR